MQAFLRRMSPACTASLVLAAVLTGCGDQGTEPSGPEPINYDAIDPIIYSQHIQPLFQMSCNTAACHNDADAAGASGLALTSYSKVALGSRFGTQVIPFRADRSHLYLQTTGDIEPRMPLALDPLPDGAIRMIKRWIDHGAPNDNGQVMYSDITRKIFVACQGENAVAVLDLDSGRLIRLVTVDQPHSIYVDKDRRRLYVTRFETAPNNVQIYDADTYELIRVGRAGTFPALLGIPHGTSQLWVTNFDLTTSNDNKVRVLDPETLQEITSFDLPVKQPHGLAMTADGKTVYVTNIGSNDISIFKTDPPRVDEASIPLPLVAGIPTQQPQQCILSPDESHLYVSALGSDKVHVLNTATLQWKTSVTVGDGPWHMAISPSTNELWVPNWLGSSVSIVSLSNPDAPVQELELRAQNPVDVTRSAFQRPIGIALGPTGTYMYVANANDDGQGQGHHPPPEGQKRPGSVTKIQIATRTVVQVEEVPNFARFVTFLP
jgi:YVTN family beta-propeller protein